MKVEAIKNESDSRLIVLPDHQRRYIEGPSDSIRDIIAAFYDMTPLKSDFNRGMSCTYNWHAESCLFSHSLVDTVTVQRTKAQAEQGQHLVFVHRIVQGTVRGQLDDLSIDRDPGNIYVFDLSRRVQCLQFPTTVQGIFAPKWMLGYDSAHHAPLISFPTGTTIGHALDTDFNRIFQKLLADNALDKLAFDRFFATLKVGLRTDEQEGDIRKLARDAISQSIQAYIEEHLESPELTIEQLLNNFGVSRASLYRMFDPHGGVRQYISNRRLYRAVLELSEKEFRRGSIVETAEKWGFSTSANFNRSVKREFGAAPGSLVGAIGFDPLSKTIRQRVYAYMGQSTQPLLQSA